MGFSSRRHNIPQELSGLDNWVMLDHLVTIKLSLIVPIQLWGWGQNSNILAHELCARSFINALDPLKILFDQISVCSAVLSIPGGSIIAGYLIIMSLLSFLLELEHFKAVKGNMAGSISAVPVTALIFRSKACTHNNFLGLKRNTYARILGSTLHPAKLADGRHQHLA